MFRVGDNVQWRSKSRAFWKEKVGVVVEVVAPGRVPPYGMLAAKYAVSSPGYAGAPRKKTSYVVLVPQGGFRRAKLYWPLASQLDLLMSTAIFAGDFERGS